MSGEILAVVQAPTVPTPVWEQVGIVVLIFVIVIPGLVVSIRWLLNDQRKAQLSSQQALLKQQQEFIEKRDIQYQDFLREQRSADQEQRGQDREKITELAKLFQMLTNELGGLVKDFQQHDTWERTKLDDMQKAIAEPKTQPRNRGSKS